jgi:hypothetical protein
MGFDRFGFTVLSAGTLLILEHFIFDICSFLTLLTANAFKSSGLII